MKSIKKNNNNIILSIGMIVKNEEKVLERCLNSLISLMEAIPSELIIADTGSTDNTVEIARRYTDNVFSFKWIDDFAAARNSTLERAKGNWYFFIDADEYLDDDIDEIISFFSNPNVYLYCKTGQIHLRNYIKSSGKDCVDMYLPRFQRINPSDEKVEFVGKVHETINMRNPQVRFSTILHHTGYYYENEEEKQFKHDRNEKIMLDLYKENPNNVRLLSLLFANEHNDELAEKYINKALEIVRENPSHYFCSTIYVQSIQHYIDIDKIKTIEICDEYEKLEKGKENVAILSVYTLKAIAYLRLEQYGKSIEVYDEYFRKYEDYKNNKLDVSAMVLLSFPGTDEEDYYNNVHNQLFGLYKLKKVDEFIEQMNIIDFHKVNIKTFEDIFNLFYVCLCEEERYEILTEFLISNIKYDSEKNDFIDSLIYKIYFTVKDENIKIKILNKVSESKQEYDFIVLSGLLIEPYTSKLNDDLKLYISEKKKGYEYAIYIAIKNGVDITDEINQINATDYSSIINTIMLNYSDFPEVISNYYIQEKYLSSIKLLNWIVSLYYIAVLNISSLTSEQKEHVYRCYISLLRDFFMNLYNIDSLLESDMDVLPITHKFGFCISKANQYLDDGDNLGYVRWLKIALKNCEEMRDVILFLLEDFKKYLK